MQFRTVAIIPARYASTRLPGKPLLPISGKPMIVRVAERAALASTVSRVLVATDDARIRDAVTAEGHECVMTSDRHETGTDRLAEVAASLDADFIVNVQGDEPMLSPATIDAAVAALAADGHCVVSTTSEPIESVDELLNPNVVKVVTRADGRALYFSRAPAPYPRDAGRLEDLAGAVACSDPSLLALCRKHTGLYVYRREFLLSYARMPQTPLERRERLEQLRILENGYDIRVVEVAERSIGVDTPEDLDRVRELWAPLPSHPRE
jgi:3-deoxy-manno-octulosonate cytidylyltransferase (CMP-KDO synthetase)